MVEKVVFEQISFRENDWLGFEIMTALAHGPSGVTWLDQVLFELELGQITKFKFKFTKFKFKY